MGRNVKCISQQINHDRQFEKTILDPINRVVTAMGFKAFNRNLIYTTSLF